MHGPPWEILRSLLPRRDALIHQFIATDGVVLARNQGNAGKRFDCLWMVLRKMRISTVVRDYPWSDSVLCSEQ